MAIAMSQNMMAKRSDLWSFWKWLWLVWSVIRIIWHYSVIFTRLQRYCSCSSRNISNLILNRALNSVKSTLRLKMVMPNSWDIFKSTWHWFSPSKDLCHESPFVYKFQTSVLAHEALKSQSDDNLGFLK